MTYIAKALLIYDDQSIELIQPVKDNHFGTEIIAVEKNKFLKEPLEFMILANHLVLSGSMDLIQDMMEFACTYNANDQHCSLAFLPLASQKTLRDTYQLSAILDENIDIALRDESKPINLLECNGQIVQSSVLIGQLPLIKSWHSDSSLLSIVQNIILGLKQFFHLSMDKINIETEKGKQVKSVASGVYVSNKKGDSRFFKSFQKNNSMRSDQFSLMVVAPFSAMEYFQFLFSMIFGFSKESSLPHGLSYIQSSEIKLNYEPSNEKPDVILDNKKTEAFPLHFKLKKNAVKINATEQFWIDNEVAKADKEVIRIDHLPDEKEMNKYIKQSLPFFSVASEDRFKDLFLQLRVDARINSLYIVLMILSTLLATFGLFSNSSAVVIGAMLLAPLMSPIIANSMGLLRGDENLISLSMKKIMFGVTLALLASSVLTVLLPQMDLSNEIKARIYPNLIDLGVAIFSGMAAAYTKSHKQLLNNLAGVAIAVALVPPLATAGIGLGRGEQYVFEGAFLLFLTNLIGITLAATLTFQFLGFSNTVKSKKRLLLIFIILMFLSYPLYRSFYDSLQRYQLTKNLVNEQLVINQKQIVIEAATVEYQNNRQIINITIVLQKALTQEEFRLLKDKIDQRFSSSHETRVSMKYIL